MSCLICSGPIKGARPSATLEQNGCQDLVPLTSRSPPRNETITEIFLFHKILEIPLSKCHRVLEFLHSGMKEGDGFCPSCRLLVDQSHSLFDRVERLTTHLTQIQGRVFSLFVGSGGGVKGEEANSRPELIEMIRKFSTLQIPNDKPRKRGKKWSKLPPPLPSIAPQFLQDVKNSFELCEIRADSEGRRSLGNILVAGNLGQIRGFDLEPPLPIEGQGQGQEQKPWRDFTLFSQPDDVPLISIPTFPPPPTLVREVPTRTEPAAAAKISSKSRPWSTGRKHSFTCLLCPGNRGFKGPTRLHAHYTDFHSNPKTWPCPVSNCDQVFSRAKILWKHRRWIHKDLPINKVKLNVPVKVKQLHNVKTRSSLRKKYAPPKIQSNHSKVGTKTAKKCVKSPYNTRSTIKKKPKSRGSRVGMKPPSPPSLRAHFQCLLCDEVHLNASRLGHHYAETHKRESEGGMWPCAAEGCGMVFVVKHDLYRHRARVHKNLPVNYKGGGKAGENGGRKGPKPTAKAEGGGGDVGQVDADVQLEEDGMAQD